MDIQVKIDFSHYSPQDIIGFLKEGIVTVKEVEESGIAHKFFTNMLHDYLSNAKRQALGDTVIVNQPTVVSA